MISLSRALLTISLIWLFLVPADAHHSYDAEFDRRKPIEFEGTVRRFEWKNPHAYLYVDVVSDSGEVVTWMLQLGGPPALSGRLGWTRSTLAAGDEVIVDGYEARQGENSGVARLVTTASGETLQATLGLQRRPRR
jgi:hypothetical protein